MPRPCRYRSCRRPSGRRGGPNLGRHWPHLKHQRARGSEPFCTARASFLSFDAAPALLCWTCDAAALRNLERARTEIAALLRYPVATFSLNSRTPPAD